MTLQIACGDFHTACIDKDETVYTWGCGGSGRLGHDKEDDVPVRVHGLEPSWKPSWRPR